MSISYLEKRLEILELPTKSGLDPLVLALECLNNNELGLVDEFRSLINAGFLPEEIQDLMAHDAYVVAINAMEKVDQELQKLEAPVRPKRTGKLTQSLIRAQVKSIDTSSPGYGMLDLKPKKHLAGLATALELQKWS